MSLPATMSEIGKALNITRQAASIRATKEQWAYTEEPAPGGMQKLFDLNALPKEIKAAVQQHRLASLIPRLCLQETLPSPVAAVSPSETTDIQRHREAARNAVLDGIVRIRLETRCTLESAIATLLTTAKMGMAPNVIRKQLLDARDSRGIKGDELPSSRTIKRWMAAETLVPKLPQKDMSVPTWAAHFLAIYQRPEKPALTEAYREACQQWGGSRPSIHTVRRFLKKMGHVSLSAGRMGPRELKNIRPFIRRTTEHLLPNDVWTADGHKFDAEITSPRSGRPVRAEITPIIDIATRRIVGCDIDFAENALSVVTALRLAVKAQGLPAMFYVDNGSGFKNAVLSDQFTGLMGRLGCHITHSLPYNSQARGLSERGHQFWTMWAKKIPGYIGQDMDREAKLAQFKLSRKAIAQGGTLPLMGFEAFITFINDGITEYNNRPHRALGGVSPNQKLAQFVEQGWAPMRLPPEEDLSTFLPRIQRTVRRGELEVFNNRYFSRTLEEFHSEEVQVAYDVHCAETVWVYDLEGRFITTAAVNGNARHYFPVPVIEQARDKRAQGQMKRLNAKAQAVRAERKGTLELPRVPEAQILVGGIPLSVPLTKHPHNLEAVSVSNGEAQSKAQDARQPPTPRRRSEQSAAQNYAEWAEIGRALAAGHTVSEQDERFYQSWPGTSQGRVHLNKLKSA